MYPDQLVAPMKKELTDIGFKELKSAQDVDDLLKNEKGTVLVVVNSVCGCAAGAARPGLPRSAPDGVTRSGRGEGGGAP